MFKTLDIIINVRNKFYIAIILFIKNNEYKVLWIGQQDSLYGTEKYHSKLYIEGNYRLFDEKVDTKYLVKINDNEI